MFSDQAGTPGIVSTRSVEQAHLRHYGLLALFVLLLSLIGIYWRPLGQLSTLWPANAVLLGVFLRLPQLVSAPGWIAAAAGLILADLLTGSPLLLATSLTAVNLLSVFVALRICSSLTATQLSEMTPDALPRLFLAMLTASAAAGVSGGLVTARLLGADPWDAGVIWGTSELLAYIILVPCVLSAPRPRTSSARDSLPVVARRLAPKLIPAASLLAAFLAGLFIGGPGVIAFPVSALLVCALSCNLFQTSLLTLAFSLWTLLGIAFGNIAMPFDTGSTIELLSLRLGVASTALAPIVVASVMAARERNLALMRHLAEHDPLTGLLNRRTFHQRAQALLAADDTRDAPAAILMVDVDNFKLINDTYGHAVGDAVLSRVARKLRESLRSTDLCGRVGGEEFAALIPHSTPAQIESVTRRIHEAIRSEQLRVSDPHADHLRVSVSIGATLSQGESDDLRSMLHRADLAMYAAKQAGRDQTRML